MRLITKGSEPGIGFGNDGFIRNTSLYKANNYRPN